MNKKGTTRRAQDKSRVETIIIHTASANVHNVHRTTKWKWFRLYRNGILVFVLHCMHVWFPIGCCTVEMFYYSLVYMRFFANICFFSRTIFRLSVFRIFSLTLSICTFVYGAYAIMPFCGYKLNAVFAINFPYKFHRHNCMLRVNRFLLLLLLLFFPSKAEKQQATTPILIKSEELSSTMLFVV